MFNIYILRVYWCSIPNFKYVQELVICFIYFYTDGFIISCLLLFYILYALYSAVCIYKLLIMLKFTYKIHKGNSSHKTLFIPFCQSLTYCAFNSLLKIILRFFSIFYSWIFIFNSFLLFSWLIINQKMLWNYFSTT